MTNKEKIKYLKEDLKYSKYLAKFTLDKAQKIIIKDHIQMIKFELYLLNLENKKNANF